MKSLVLLLVLLVAICGATHVSVDVDVSVGATKPQEHHATPHSSNNNIQPIHNGSPTTIQEAVVAAPSSPIQASPQISIPTSQSPAQSPLAEVDDADVDPAAGLQLSTLSIIVGGVEQRLVPDFDPSFTFYKVTLDTSVPTLRVHAEANDESSDVSVILNGQFQHLMTANQFTSNELRLQPGVSSNKMRLRLHNSKETKDYSIMIHKVAGAKNIPSTSTNTPTQQTKPSQPNTTPAAPVSTPTTPSSPPSPPTPPTPTHTTTPTISLPTPQTIALPENLVVPTPSQPTAPKRTYNKECHVKLNGRNYNLKDYVYKHSGGPAGIVNCCGKDCTPFFFQNHSSNYLKLLSPYLA